MKKIVLLLTLVFAFQNVALAMPAQSLKSVYQDYLYATTVEWDQVDGAHIAEINSKFAQEIADLQESGLLTEASLHELFEAELKAGRLSHEILQQVLTPAGTIDIAALREAFVGMQTRGANWNGTGKTMFKIVAWGFLPALIIIAVITTSGRKDLCTETGAGYGLHEPFACN